jgi:hypothetical protein
MSTIARAKVTLTVEIEVGSTWGDDCSLSQVYDQAARETIQAVKNIFQRRVTIIGEPTVDAVMVRK